MLTENTCLYKKGVVMTNKTILFLNTREIKKIAEGSFLNKSTYEVMMTVNYINQLSK